MTAVASVSPDGTAWLLELFSDARTHALPAAWPELRLLAAEAAGRGPAPVYDADVTSRERPQHVNGKPRRTGRFGAAVNRDPSLNPVSARGAGHVVSRACPAFTNTAAAAAELDALPNRPVGTDGR